MIRSLRRRHRLMIVALAVIVPALYVAALVARDTIPRGRAPSDAMPGRADTLDRFEREIDGATLVVTTYRWAASPSGLAATAVFEPASKRPDVLVYWLAGSGDTTTDTPLETAPLLGSAVAGARLDLPAEAAYESGSLLLYSLGHDEILAVVPLGDAGAR